jgi:hypothetical protein
VLAGMRKSNKWIQDMFIVLLKFSDNKAQAGKFMEGHKA